MGFSKIYLCGHVEIVLLVPVGYPEDLHFWVLWGLLGRIVLHPIATSAPIVSGLTGLSGIEASFGMRQSPVIKPSSPKLLILARLLFLKIFLLRFCFNKNGIEKQKGSKNLCMRVGCLEMVSSIHFLEVAVRKGVGYSLRKSFRELHGPNCLRRDLKIRYTSLSALSAAWKYKSVARVYMRWSGTIRVPTICVRIRGTERNFFQKFFRGETREFCTEIGWW